MSFCSLAEGVRVGWEPLDEVVVILSEVLVVRKSVVRAVWNECKIERFLGGFMYSEGKGLCLLKRSRSILTKE